MVKGDGTPSQSGAMITLRRLSCSGTSCPLLNLMACHPPEEELLSHEVPSFFVS
ncbi:hypothetical protein NC653_023710 [Populus alba x Populus x berolinensis]|uniref:Uncharacterized protein n=1 Tax=Populus alba x Populus x berolinensis TaxID=444605 RepID=A0AAD6MIA3_9ROSI|nr:hypothetical protein NC653_023710 [Populus alba x Populus x berolinensis]